MLEDDVAGHFCAVRSVKPGIHQYFKAFGCLFRQYDGEGFGHLGGGWLSHALLLQCLGNAFKLILAEGGLGLPIAADGVRP